MKKIIVFAIVSFAAFAVLSGCAAFNKMVTNDALITQLAVESATARVIHEHPTWKLNAVNVTGAAIVLIDSSATVQIKDVEKFVRANIPWNNLLPEEQAILSALITQTTNNLNDSFRSQGVVDPGKQMVEVKQVLQWIHDAANRQGGAVI